MTLDDARVILAEVARPDGWLVWPAKPPRTFSYVTFNPKYGALAALDGSFSADELEAIAVWMRAHTGAT